MADPLLARLAGADCDDDCEGCGGAGLVCENHQGRAWPDECDCGAGMPCPYARRPEK